MRQQVHSEVFLRVMERQRKRRVRKQILLTILLILLVIIEAYLIACVVPNMNVTDTAEPEMATEEADIALPIVSESKISTEISKISTNTVDLSANTVEKTSKQEAPWTEEEAYLLKKIAMAEAEGECTECKALVMLVILNRVKDDRFPDSIEDVIFQKGQFTPVRNGRFQRVEPNEDCEAALKLIESGWDESQGAIYFEVTTNNKTWHNQNLYKLFEHCKTSFYTEE